MTSEDHMTDPFTNEVTPADVPPPNGLARDVPVLGTEPAKPKRKRRTKAEMAAARAADARKKAKKQKSQSSTVSAVSPPDLRAPAAVEDAPAPAASPSLAPGQPFRSFERLSWWDGVRHMVVFDRPRPAFLTEPDPNGVAMITPRVPFFLKVAYAACAAALAAGAAYPWL